MSSGSPRPSWAPTEAFAGIPTFLRAPLITDPAALMADIAVIGAPSDEGSPFAGGARFGPRSIREQSLRFSHGIYDIETDTHLLDGILGSDRIADVGDIEVIPTNAERTFEHITQAIRDVRATGAMPVTIGGDHAISFPVVRAFDDAPLFVVHFDAHTDYLALSDDVRHNNGQPFRSISGLGHVEKITQVGIRSIRNGADEIRDSRADGNDVISISAFRDMGPEGIVAFLPEGARAYVSIDVDVYDSTLVPGCVSAEPNGMTYAELMGSLAAVARHVDVVGFDLVEVNPLLDVHTGVTSYLGAHTIIEFLHHVTVQPRWRDRFASTT